MFTKIIIALSLVTVGCGGLTVKQPEDTVVDLGGTKPTPTPTPSVPGGRETIPTPTPIPTVAGGGTASTTAANVKDVVISMEHVPNVTYSDVAGCDTMSAISAISPDVLQGNVDDLYSADMTVRAFKWLDAKFNGRQGGCATSIVMLPRMAVATIPSKLVLLSGNAGNRVIYLQLGNFRCAYLGGAHVADPTHPFRANQVELGRQISWAGCGCAGIKAGDTVFVQALSVYFAPSVDGIDMEVGVDLELSYPIYSLEEIDGLE
jgi:hypothetical protein